MEAVAWRDWRRTLHVCRGHAAGHCFFAPGRAGPGNSWSSGGVGRGHSLGNDVHSLPQGLSHGDEPAIVHYILHDRRSAHHVVPRADLSRAFAAVARTYERTSGAVLAYARRIGLGAWRSFSAIRYQVRWHQPRHSIVEHEPTVGTAVGNPRFSRVARWWSHRLRPSGRGIAVDGGGCGCDRT